MKLKLQNPLVLSKIMDLISEFVSEVRIKVSEYGMNITALDPANVAMVGFKMPKSAFLEFESDPETIGINLDSFKKILKRGGSTSTFILEKKGNLLEIEIQDRIKRNFSLSLIDIESSDIDFNSKTANMNFTSKIEIKSVDLIDALEDCSVVSDACSFIIKDKEFIIEAKGLDTLNSSRINFSLDELKISGEECKARYSLEYLQKFIKGAKLCEITHINFSHDHPLKLDFKISPMELNFVLAPRMETED